MYVNGNSKFTKDISDFTKGKSIIANGLNNITKWKFNLINALSGFAGDYFGNQED
jgi:hypothetical protein